MIIPAITIWQPWASLLAILAKLYETRSWATNYRGPIAIHAGQKDHADMMSSEQINALMRALAGTRYEVAHNRIGGGYDYIYPYGVVIATAELVGCHKIVLHGGRGLSSTSPGWLETEDGIYIPTHRELLFGDWTPGRYAWEFTNMKLLDQPVPAKGRQGLWKWEGMGHE